MNKENINAIIIMILWFTDCLVAYIVADNLVGKNNEIEFILLWFTVVIVFVYIFKKVFYLSKNYNKSPLSHLDWYNETFKNSEKYVNLKKLT